MIWYYIGDKKIIIPDNFKHKLTLTYVNLHELVYSPHVEKNWDYFENACKAVFKYANKIILCNPILHLRNTLNPNEKQNCNYDIFEKLKYLADHPKLDKAILEELREKRKQKKEIFSDDFIKYNQKEINKSREIIHKNIREFKQIMKKKRTRLDLEESTKKQIYNIVLSQECANFKTSYSEINDDQWKQIELYLFSRISYYNKMKINDSVMKSEENDPGDMLNLQQFSNKNRACLIN